MSDRNPVDPPDDLPAAAPAAARDPTQAVLDVLAAVLQSPVTARSRREDIAPWDSLRHIELVCAIEDALEVQFTPQQAGALNSVAHIIDIIRQKPCTTPM